MKLSTLSKLTYASILASGFFLVNAPLAKATEKVRICLPIWKADQMKTAVILAEKQGYFKKSGLEVEFVTHQSAEALNQNFNRGKASLKLDDFAQADIARLNGVAETDSTKRPCDFAVALSDAILQSGVAPEKFEPLLFSRYGHGYDTHLIVPKNSKIQSAKDLKGKTLALGPVMSRVALDAMLEQAGLVSSDVKVVSTNPFQRVQQMRSGEIDAAIIYNPAMAILLSEGSVRVIEENIVEKYLKVPVPHTALLANTLFAKKHPKAVASVIEAIESGNRTLSSDPTLLATVTEEYAKARGEKFYSYGASKVTLAKSAQIMGDFKLYRINSMMSNGTKEISVLDALNKFQDALFQYGYVGKKVDLSKWMDGKKLDVKSAGVGHR